MTKPSILAALVAASLLTACGTAPRAVNQAQLPAQALGKKAPSLDELRQQAYLLFIGVGQAVAEVPADDKWAVTATALIAKGCDDVEKLTAKAQGPEGKQMHAAAREQNEIMKGLVAKMARAKTQDEQKAIYGEVVQTWQRGLQAILGTG